MVADTGPETRVVDALVFDPGLAEAAVLEARVELEVVLKLRLIEKPSNDAEDESSTEYDCVLTQVSSWP